jgi:hypothetical protein
VVSRPVPKASLASATGPTLLVTMHVMRNEKSNFAGASACTVPAMGVEASTSQSFPPVSLCVPASRCSYHPGAFLCMPPTRTNFEIGFRIAVRNALQTLLSEKHLYQRIKVDASFIEGGAKSYLASVARRDFTGGKVRLNSGGASNQNSPADRLKEAGQPGRDLLYIFNWFPIAHHTSPIQLGEIDIEVVLPTIMTYCDACKGRWPFKAVEGLCHTQTDPQFISRQYFTFGYECQKCSGAPVRYLVHRQGDVMTNVGRHPFEKVVVPPQIPRSGEKHFSAALIAFQTGQFLPAIFMLRVFIEQFWLLHPEVRRLKKGQEVAHGRSNGQSLRKLASEASAIGLPFARPCLCRT